MDENQPGGGPLSSGAETHLNSRRKSTRKTALFRPALLDTGNFHSFCLVKNISDSGLMATLHAPVERGQAISIRFDEAIELAGKIAWHEDDRAGIEFLEPIDVAELLVSLSGQASQRGNYRSPRLEIEVDAAFIVHGKSHAIRVKDISQRGVKAAVLALGEGEEGTIALPGLQARKAVTRWTKNDLAGFYFLDPIGFSELGQWVLAHGERERSKHTN